MKANRTVYMLLIILSFESARENYIEFSEKYNYTMHLIPLVV